MIRIVIYKNSISENSEKKEFILDNDELLQFGKLKDKLTIDADGKYIIERKVKLNNMGGYVLVEEIETGEIPNFVLFEGINVITIDSGKETKVQYVIKSLYNKGTRALVNTQIAISTHELQLKLNEKTDVQEVTSMINLNNQGIMNEVSKKVGEDEIISKINQTPEQIKIQAKNIALEGTTTINNGFKVLLDGSIEANNAKINGNLVTSQGVYTMLHFKASELGITEGNLLPGVGGYSLTGYQLVDSTGGHISKVYRVPREIQYSIPTNFTVDYAYIEIKNKQTTFNIYNENNVVTSSRTGNLGPFEIWQGDGFNYLALNVAVKAWGMGRVQGIPSQRISAPFPGGATNYNFTKTGSVRTNDISQHLDDTGAVYVYPTTEYYASSANYPYHSNLALDRTAWARADLYVYGWVNR